MLLLRTVGTSISSISSRNFASKPMSSTLRRRVMTVTTRPSSEASLVEKFNLASLTGGKSPFDVSSHLLLHVTPTLQQMSKTSRPNQSAAMSVISDRQLHTQYSLDYLMGNTASKTMKKTKNPFQVTSAKLM